MSVTEASGLGVTYNEENGGDKVVTGLIDTQIFLEAEDACLDMSCGELVIHLHLPERYGLGRRTDTAGQAQEEDDSRPSRSALSAAATRDIPCG